MKVDRATVGLLYRTELRMLLRDRRALVIAVVLPLLLFPLLLWIMHYTTTQRQHRREEHSYRYCVSGTAAATLRDAIRRSVAYSATQVGNADERLHFTEVSAGQPRRELAAGRVDLWISLEAGHAEAKTPTIHLDYQQSRDPSSTAALSMLHLLHRARDEQRESLLHARGIAIQLEKAGDVEEENVAPPHQLAGLALGRVLTPLLLFFLFSAGALVATDTLAGEKERKTLETLLTTAASRNAIVFAKLLLIATVMLVITVIQGVNFAVYIAGKVFPLPATLIGAVTPGTAPLLLLMYLPLVALVSAVLLLVSGYAKTYKEAQLYFTPVLLVGACFGAVALFPDTNLHSLLLLVPVTNIALAVRDLLAGTLDWPAALLAWGITAGTAIWVGWRTTQMLASERLINSMEHDADTPLHGPSSFSRHVLRWYALLWAVMVICGNYLSTPKLLPVQLLVNSLLLFLGGTLLLIYRYRLNWREALAIRPVRPLVWLAVLVAAPCGVIAGIGLFQLTNYLLPIPPEWLKNPAFAQPLGHIPLWSKLLLLGVLPGICEEIAFRGLLLYGLHKTLRPAALAITVGVIFALFHFIIFRLPTTAMLGILLATTTLLTGSILPGMLWHMTNNMLAVSMESYAGQLDKLGPWGYLAATALLALAMYVIYRNRSVYPGLRDRPQYR